MRQRGRLRSARRLAADVRSNGWPHASAARRSGAASFWQSCQALRHWLSHLVKPY